MLAKLEINIPETVLQVLGVRKHDLGQHFRSELAMHYFEKGRLSFGQARELANLSTWDFLDLLRDNKIALHYDLSEYEEDLEAISNLTNG